MAVKGVAERVCGQPADPRTPALNPAPLLVRVRMWTAVSSPARRSRAKQDCVPLVSLDPIRPALGHQRRDHHLIRPQSTSVAGAAHSRQGQPRSRPTAATGSPHPTCRRTEGIRFFPGFYPRLTNTMRRIPGGVAPPSTPGNADERKIYHKGASPRPAAARPSCTPSWVTARVSQLRSPSPWCCGPPITN